MIMINKSFIQLSIKFYFPESDELVNIKNTSDEISIKFIIDFYFIDLLFDHVYVCIRFRNFNFLLNLILNKNMTFKINLILS